MTDRTDLPIVALIELIVLVPAFWLNRGYRIHLGVFLTLLLIFLALGEFYFRLHYFGLDGLSFGRCRPAGYGHPWSNFEFDESTYTGLKPNTVVSFKGKSFRVNAQGFRGKDYPFEKGTNVYRIVMAGASATIGSGLTEEENLPTILEDRLNRAGLSRKVELVNLSISGSKFGEMLHVLREVGVRYDPDMLLFLANESLIPTGEMRIQALKAHKIRKTTAQLILDQKYDFFSSRFFLAGLLSAFREGEIGRAARWEVISLPKDGGASRRDENLRTALTDLDRMKGHAHVVLYLLRPILELKNPNYSPAYREKLRTLAAQFKMTVADTYRAHCGKFEENDLIVYPGDKHPNVIAQNVFADEMVPVLLRVIRDEEQKPRQDRSVPGTEKTVSTTD
jgi:hypothetical protein